MTNKNNEPVTKKDLSEFKSELKAEFKKEISRLDEKIYLSDASLKTELKENINSVKAELKGDINSVKAELKEDINRLDKKIDKAGMYNEHAHDEMNKKLDAALEKITAMCDRVMMSHEDTVFKGVKYDQKAESHGKILIAHEDSIVDHENWISSLEKR